MTAGTSVPDRYAAYSAAARCRAWVRTRPHVWHHLVSAVAMLACVLVDHRPVPSMLVIVALIVVSVPVAIGARAGDSAREHVLDLGVMTVCMLAMAPWDSPAGPSSSAMSMSPASMAADGHSGGSVGGVVMVLALAFWVVARVGLLASAGAPRTAAVLRAVVCLACLAWMVS